MKELYNLFRENIKQLTPYSTARDDCKAKMDIYLDANENPYNNGVNRYPSPFQYEVKSLISSLKKIPVENIFLGNGSDEPIDLIYRIFCEPGKSSALIVTPGYGMYSVAARINDVQTIESLLSDKFELESNKVLSDIRPDTKVVFICSPNNPSSNLLDKEEIEKIIVQFNGIVVVDEAYIDFADTEGFTPMIKKYSNLIVLQTLSKAWGMAGLRLGMAIACPLIINTMNQVKYPYNISVVNQQKAIELLQNILPAKERIDIIKKEREALIIKLTQMKGVEKVFPSQANFLLVRFKDKDIIFNGLQSKGIIVRDRSSLPGCSGCLRITVGTPQENKALLDALYAINGMATPNEKEIPGTEAASKEIKEGKTERKALVTRNTKETSIQISINLDNFSNPFVSTGLYFFNHMLEQIGYHGGIGLNIICSGDLATDDHHTIEDTAIALGEALYQALGDKKGIERYGFSLPMDEADATVLMDLGGRIDFAWDVKFLDSMIGDVHSQMFEHFFKSISEHLKCNLHIKASGKNDHHVIEGVFKAFARALKCAVRQDQSGFGIPSSKGTL